ncbi:polysaccharide deacetylase family protein [Chitinibacter sp. GC72]|uniref:polysaccharide deacetylase family protein n=1 Tax=Chitinibacter sp. GC72 TaxID=1526917 RepID=UPI0012FB3B64|nr:polysaccharide deacetylase family protein [Chitinibacter sp. GC72]
MRLSSGLILASLMLSHLVLAQTPPRLRTPVIDNRGQVPAATLERQAQQFPATFFLEGAGDKKEIAFTFDDGPSADTPALLDVLKKENVKATFFWLGQSVLQHPDIVKRALAEGHVLANHSFSHPNLSKMADDAQWWDAQLQRTQQAFQKVVGFQPAMMRPPYGFLNDSQISKLKEQGMTAILWSVDSADWYHIWQNNADDVASGKIDVVIRQYIHPEAIVLMHDAGGRGRQPTVMAVQALIPALREQGYRFTTVDRLLGIPAKLPASAKASTVAP